MVVAAHYYLEAPQNNNLYKGVLGRFISCAPLLPFLISHS